MKQPTLAELEDFHKFLQESYPNLKQPAIVVYGLNTYHFGINGYKIPQMRQKLFLPHARVGIHRAELSEDIFERDDATDLFKGMPTEDFGWDPPLWLTKRIEKIKELADKCNIIIESTGTGQFLYTRMLNEAKKGFLDMDPKERAEAMNVFYNYINIARLLGASIIGGHRVMTAYPNVKEFRQKQPLEKWAKKLRWDIPSNLDDVVKSYTQPCVEISRAEAENIALAIKLNRYDQKVSNTTELMYQHDGMAPVSIGQMIRMLYIIQENSPQRVYAHMDIGHVIVGGSGSGKEKDDYNLMKYAERVVWDRWLVHFNSLFENNHYMPTASNVANDLNMRDSAKTTKVIHPDLYCNVYDWLAETAKKSKVMQITPEPKYTKDLSKLVREAEEVGNLINMALGHTHKAVTQMPGYYVPKQMYSDFCLKFCSKN